MLNENSVIRNRLFLPCRQAHLKMSIQTLRQEPMKARITERVISSKPSKKITVTITTAILLREERVCRTALGTLSNRSINTTSKGKTMRRKGIARLQAKINIIKGKKTRFPKRSTLRDRHSERTRARLNKMQAFPSINF